MKKFHALEPAIDPNNRITFLLDWELTLKCNLDCSYCGTGHDNSMPYPSLEESLRSIDFMFEYADLYMKTKPNGIRYVVLNIYGGEAMTHPDIIKILDEVHKRYNPYRDNWHLTVTTTTNLIIKPEKLKNYIPYIEEFTCSYHTESTPTQQDWFRSNLLFLKENNRRIKVIVLMHTIQENFENSLRMMEWLDKHEIKYLPRALDHGISQVEFNYSEKQKEWFNNFFKSKTYKTDFELTVEPKNEKFDLANDGGRACCGGRQVCLNGNLKSREFFVHNNFYGWNCSVNHFFVFVRQWDGAIFTNRDCRVNYDGVLGPIGNLADSEKLLDFTRQNLQNDTLPVIKCCKHRCKCGLCAPKADDPDTYNNLMRKYYRP